MEPSWWEASYSLMNGHLPGLIQAATMFPNWYPTTRIPNSSYYTVTKNPDLEIEKNCRKDPPKRSEILEKP